MRYIPVILLVLFLVIGCGCSNEFIMPIPPAYGYTNDNKDVWPAFYGTDNGGPDNGYMVFYDQGAATWDVPRLIANDLADSQWLPQRNAVGWTTDGTWNATFIEDSSNDIEIWESPDADWQDEAGAWTLTDDDNSENWVTCDVESRQNYIYVLAEDGSNNLAGGYIDLSAGVPAWAFPVSTAKSPSYGDYSLVLDCTLRGISWGAYGDAVTNVNVFAAYIIPNTTSAPNASGDVPAGIAGFPQILWSPNTTYTFGISSDILILYIPHNETYDDEDWTEVVYNATTMLYSYHATWLKLDDTIHVALVDTDAATPNNTHLIYMRRSANGWVEEEILLTVDGEFLGSNDGISWPQITVDTLGNIFIYYIYEDVQGTGGDLQGFYLDASVYSAPVVGNWVQHTNIDQSGSTIIWVVAPDSIPVSADM